MEMIGDFNSNENTSSMGLNQFVDWTDAEVKALVSGYRVSGNGQERKEPKVLNTEGLPASVNWVERGAVTPIEAEGWKCASCWAFAAKWAVEGTVQIKTGKLYNLSLQQLIDCAGEKWGNFGCEGGMMENSFAYISQGNPLMTEADYPYTESDDACKYNPAKAVGRISGYHMV